MVNGDACPNDRKNKNDHQLYYTGMKNSVKFEMWLDDQGDPAADATRRPTKLR
jgi:hypothetical protein